MFLALLLSHRNVNFLSFIRVTFPNENFGYNYPQNDYKIPTLPVPLVHGLLKLCKIFCMYLHTKTVLVPHTVI